MACGIVGDQMLFLSGLGSRLWAHCCGGTIPHSFSMKSRVETEKLLDKQRYPKGAETYFAANRPCVRDDNVILAVVISMLRLTPYNLFAMADVNDYQDGARDFGNVFGWLRKQLLEIKARRGEPYIIIGKEEGDQRNEVLSICIQVGDFCNNPNHSQQQDSDRLAAMLVTVKRWPTVKDYEAWKLKQNPLPEVAKKTAVRRKRKLEV